MTDAPFLPSDVVLNDALPLVGCFGKSECECAAAMIVRMCQILENRWQAVRAQDLGGTLKARGEAGEHPVAGWMTNPFFLPDFETLARRGYATITPAPDGARMEFTARGLRQLRRWVRGLS